jgi:dihydrofolate synthase/folylpolyglutamate synthase
MKNYESVIEWMFSKLPMYQHVGKKAFKKDLTNISLLLDHIKHPEKKFKSVHIAGTNGKGSVACMLASVLIEAGYKVGLYTSPHLKDFTERIKVNNKPVRKKFIMGFINRHKDFLEEHGLSFFEMTVAMAYEYFFRNNVDIAIIETGMGGRLDSTNVITPVLSVITNIQKDHTEFLGETLEEIALEKAGIIKPGVPVILGDDNPAVRKVIENVAKQNAVELIIPAVDPERYETDLKGPYQKQNLSVVLEAVNHLRVLGFALSEPVLRKGLSQVRRNTGLRGRWDVVSKNPLIIFDTAHNPAAVKIIAEALNGKDAEKKHFVLSFVKGKDIRKMLSYFPDDARYYISEAKIPRAFPVDELARIFEKSGRRFEIFRTVKEAFEAAKQAAGKRDLIFVGGSTFTVAEVI